MHQNKGVKEVSNKRTGERKIKGKKRAYTDFLGGKIVTDIMN